MFTRFNTNSCSVRKNVRQTTKILLMSYCIFNRWILVFNKTKYNQLNIEFFCDKSYMYLKMLK